MTDTPGDAATASDHKWRPLNSRQRRVLGVLVEKAKTTPDVYPMTVNGIVSGSNQKSNREPQMTLAPDDVEQVLEELRAMGAVTEVQGSGRVAKYRHHFYDWLGVDKAESAVMTELLLRGEQTLGDLRSRAARMDAIPDQGALKLIVNSLIQKNLMIELTPPGRGQIVSHNLYKERELVEIRAHYAGRTPLVTADDGEDDEPPPRQAPPPAAFPSVPPLGAGPGKPQTSAPSGVTADMLAELSVELAELRAEFARLRDRMDTLEQQVRG
jgi:uncharacterized protein YceH (UPF0502 family)